MSQYRSRSSNNNLNNFQTFLIMTTSLNTALAVVIIIIFYLSIFRIPPFFKSYNNVLNCFIVCLSKEIFANMHSRNIHFPIFLRAYLYYTSVNHIIVKKKIFANVFALRIVLEICENYSFFVICKYLIIKYH